MKNKRETTRRKRKLHIRKKISGSADKPRVYVFRSNKALYVGVADDSTGKVLLSNKSAKSIESAGEMGKKVGTSLKKMKIEKIVFDRSGYKYHGRVKALADGMRESGIQF